jgi:hypothetical protein
VRLLGAVSSTTSTCPGDEELAQFLDRRLARPRAQQLEAHFDRCQDCRELVFMLAALDPQKA